MLPSHGLLFALARPRRADLGALVIGFLSRATLLRILGIAQLSPGALVIFHADHELEACCSTSHLLGSARSRRGIEEEARSRCLGALCKPSRLAGYRSKRNKRSANVGLSV
jgi:hypothetical protein